MEYVKSKFFSIIDSFNFFIHMNKRLLLLLLPLLLLCAPSAAQLPGGMIKSPLEIRRQQQRAKRKAKPKARPKAKAKARARKKSHASARPSTPRRYTRTESSPEPSTLSQGPSPTLGTSTHVPNVLTFKANGVTFQMVEVQGGTFMMGATSEQGSDADNDEKPAHRVTLSGFYIGKYEVTQSLWRAVMGSNPSSTKGDNGPVTNVSWNDCQRFISELNLLTGKRFRLPTEAEWEYAARGGNRSRGYKYSGSDNPDEVAWYSSNSGGDIRDVGTKRPNELGVYDMSGNVYEWCQDWYGSYSNLSQTNPTVPSSGSNRVSRGGCWIDYARSCRSSIRNYFTPDVSFNGLGLRLVLQSPDSEYTLSEADKTAIDSLIANMVHVEGGSFKMGAKGEESDEIPVHRVKLSGFYIGKYEVTQREWEAVMGYNPSSTKGDNYPVTNVSWIDCQGFISRLNSLTGKNFRLPTEAEWEYAARGGNRSRGYKYSGSDNLGEVAWYDGNSGGGIRDVGTKRPNELGIYDMSGNVCEWCADWYGEYRSAAQTNPTGPSSGSNRVYRGGSWYFNARFCRSSNRFYGTPDGSVIILGLRLALSE